MSTIDSCGNYSEDSLSSGFRSECFSPAFASHRTDAHLGSIELAGLGQRSSLSAILSPYKECPPLLQQITYKGSPLDSVHLVLLALNEECRGLDRGCFYHLPLRKDRTVNHPCDLIFVDEAWNTKDASVWDDSNWVQRLNMCCAGEFILPDVGHVESN